jgi:hypothetical protein
LVPPGPYDVHRPSGSQLTRHPSAEASGGPPWTSALLQSSSPGTRAVPPGKPAVRRHFLSWTFFALRHDPRPEDTHDGSGSLRHRAPRPGFGYPPRGCCLQPSRRRSVGASMGFTLQGLPLAAIGTPLGARTLLPLPAGMTPPRRVASVNAAGFRALFLRRVRSVAGITNDPSRRYLLGFPPSRACSYVTWRAL